MKQLILPSFAKVNLYLEVVNRRKDNFHTLRTVFERISLHDIIYLTRRDDGRILVRCDSAQVPGGESNLAYRSANLLQKRYKVSGGVSIFIRKRIPVGSGMGGGSSNAACVLSGLNRLWDLRLPKSKLAVLGRKIGADVPFFIADIPFGLGTQRGDEISALQGLHKVRLWHILVFPRFSVSTPLIYQTYDRIKSFGLTKPQYNVKILLLTLEKNPLSWAGGVLFNSLEQVSVKLYPEIQRVKDDLIHFGVKSVLMSGSGPTVFGITASRKQALTACRSLSRLGRWAVFAARTV